MKLHGYMAIQYCKHFFLILSLLAFFQYLVDLTEMLRKFGAIIDYRNVSFLAILKLPQGIQTILPLVILLSSISMFLSASRKSELVIMRASGRSGLAIIIAPTLTAFTIGMASVGIFNPIVATTSNLYAQTSEMYRDGDRSILSVGSEGLWLREGGLQGQRVIHAAHANAEGTIFYDVSFLNYAADNSGPFQRILAREAHLESNEWVLKNARVWPLIAGENPEAGAMNYDTLHLSSTLTKESIRDRFGEPSVIPFWGLVDFIAELEAAGFSARRHIVWLQTEIAKPFFFTALLMLGAAFTMRPVRLGKTGLPILAAVILGFGFYYIRKFSQIMGENGQLHPLVATWVPTFAFFLIALAFILNAEDG